MTRNNDSPGPAAWLQHEQCQLSHQPWGLKNPSKTFRAQSCHKGTHVATGWGELPPPHVLGAWWVSKAAVWACCWGLRGSQQSKAGPSALFKQHRRAWAEFTLQQTHWAGEEEQSPVIFGIYSQFPLRIHGNTQLPLQACNFTQFPSNSTCISGAFYTSRRKNHLQK